MDWQCLLLCDAHKIAINRWRPFCFIFPSFCRSINSSEREGNYRITSYWTSQLWMCECVKQDGRRANKSEQNLYWWQTIKNSTQGLLFVSVVLLVVHFFFFLPRFFYCLLSIYRIVLGCFLMPWCRHRQWPRHIRIRAPGVFVSFASLFWLRETRSINDSIVVRY